MAKRLRTLTALAAASLAGLGLAACGGGMPSNAVVQVDQTPITKDAFNHWMKVAAFSAAASTNPTTSTGKSKAVVPVPPNYTACIAHLKETSKGTKGSKAPSESALKSQCKQEYEQYKNEVLLFLIGDAEWVFQQAEEMGIHVADKEVEKEFLTLKKEQYPTEEAFQNFLATSGETVSDILLRLKIDLISQKIEKKVTSKATKGITEAKIASYYKQHKSTYGKPESKNLLVVLTKTEAQAKKAKQEIESGKSFAKVVEADSIDPTSKNKGGQLNEVSRGQEERSFETAIFSAKEHVLSGPVKTPFGYYVFEVTKSNPAQQEPLSKVKSQIKQQLTAKAGETAMKNFLKGFQKKWKARTECRSGYVVEDCKNYVKPKKSTSSTPPAGTAAPEGATTGAAPEEGATTGAAPEEGATTGAAPEEGTTTGATPEGATKGQGTATTTGTATPEATTTAGGTAPKSSEEGAGAGKTGAGSSKK